MNSKQAGVPTTFVFIQNLKKIIHDYRIISKTIFVRIAFLEVNKLYLPLLIQAKSYQDLDCHCKYLFLVISMQKRGSHDRFLK